MPRFVVHKHHASRLHWDLRLEHEGVLKSWAVPKKPPTVPGPPRLAVQVQDHNVDYIDFEGEIPEGQYGAGKVLIWDNGNYTLLECNEDKCSLLFEGKKLSGEYALVRMKDKGEKNWLLIKKKPS